MIFTSHEVFNNNRVISFYKMFILEFLKSEFKSHNLELTVKTHGEEGVEIIDNEPKVVYLIPSKHLSQSDSNIFIENEVSSNTIPELAKYPLENMVNKLKP